MKIMFNSTLNSREGLRIVKKLKYTINRVPNNFKGIKKELTATTKEIKRIICEA